MKSALRSDIRGSEAGVGPELEFLARICADPSPRTTGSVAASPGIRVADQDRQRPGVDYIKTTSRDPAPGNKRQICAATCPRTGGRSEATFASSVLERMNCPGYAPCECWARTVTPGLGPLKHLARLRTPVSGTKNRPQPGELPGRSQRAWA